LHFFQVLFPISLEHACALIGADDQVLNDHDEHDALDEQHLLGGEERRRVLRKDVVGAKEGEHGDDERERACSAEHTNCPAIVRCFLDDCYSEEEEGAHGHELEDAVVKGIETRYRVALLAALITRLRVRRVSNQWNNLLLSSEIHNQHAIIRIYAISLHKSNSCIQK
jgi:hypothetical protein